MSAVYALCWSFDPRDPRERTMLCDPEDLTATQCKGLLSSSDRDGVSGSAIQKPPKKSKKTVKSVFTMIRGKSKFVKVILI